MTAACGIGFHFGAKPERTAATVAPRLGKVGLLLHPTPYGTFSDTKNDGHFCGTDSTGTGVLKHKKSSLDSQSASETFQGGYVHFWRTCLAYFDRTEAYFFRYWMEKAPSFHFSSFVQREILFLAIVEPSPAPDSFHSYFAIGQLQSPRRFSLLQEVE